MGFQVHKHAFCEHIQRKPADDGASRDCIITGKFRRMMGLSAVLLGKGRRREGKREREQARISPIDLKSWQTYSES